MNGAIIATLIVQIILSLILVVVVLFQSGNQTGLSGSIAGGAETFFGKNKGRTIDAKLKKWTSIVAILFLVSSIVLSFLVQKQENVTVNPETPAVTTPAEGDAVPVEGEEAPVEGEEAPAEGEEAPAAE